MNNERAKLIRFTTAQRQACTVHVRLTPELKDALCNAKAAGQSISVRLGNDYNKTALTVGHQEFQLTATEDGKSGLAAFLHGFDAGSECTEVGSVMHKLHVQKTLDNIDRGRIRATAEEAERKQRERRAVVMNAADMPGGRPGATTTTITTTTTTRTTASTPRPSSSGLPPKPLAVPSRPSRAASPSPSPHPIRSLELPKPGSLKAKAQQAGRTKRTPPPSQPRQTPPPPADTIRQQEDSRHPRASAGGSSSPRGAPAEEVPPAMLAAARNDNLRHCVAAALSSRPLSRMAVLEQVRGAYSRAGSRCPEEEAITEALRKLASRDPSSSLYNLRPERSSKAAPSVAGHSPPPAQQDRPPWPAPHPPKRRAQDPFGDLEVPSSPHHRPSQPHPPPPKRSRSSDLPAPSSSQPSTQPQQPPQSHPPVENGQALPPASRQHDTATTQKQTRAEHTPPHPTVKLPPATSHQPPIHPTIKLPPRRLTPPSLTPPSDSSHHLTNGHHTGPSQSTPPAPPPSNTQQSPYSGATSDTGPPTLGSDQRPFVAASAPPPAASSAPTVVPEVDPDEGQYTEFIGREAVLLGEIGSKQQLDAAQKAYMRKWGIYFSLSKKIEDFQNEMNAFWKAAQECGEPQERGRLEEALREAALRKGRMSNRWNDAFQVLHKELVSIRQVAEAYGTRAGLLPGHPAAS